MQQFVKIIGILLILSFFSCSTEKFPGFEKGENNVYYKVHHREGNTSFPDSNELVVVEMDYYLEDTVLFSSKNLDKPLRFMMIEPMFEGDLYEGLKLMGKGDSMTFAIVVDSFYLKTAKFKQLPDFVEPGSPMYYDVKLVDVMSEKEFQLVLEQERDSLKELEQELLKEYIAENKITVEPEESGLYFIPLVKGTGQRPDTGDMCQIVMEVKLVNGEILFSNIGDQPLDVEFGKNFDTKGFMEGLGMLNVGGKAQLIVPSIIGVGEKGRDLVSPFTTVIYEVELQKLKTVGEVKLERAARKKAAEEERLRVKEEEPRKLEAFINHENIQVQPTETGLYFIETEKGRGDYPEKGELVKVHYIVTRLDGFQVQDSYLLEQPAEFILGEGRVLAGWEEAVPKMRKGGKARIIVPSSLGYGPRGNGKEVGPYEPLVFDLELLDD